MKVLILLIIVSFAHARQYIQCADPNSWDRLVINLDGNDSTLFMTDGVHLPDSLTILRDIYLDSETTDFVIYKSDEAEVNHRLYIPKKVIDVASSRFEVELTFENTRDVILGRHTYRCFSAIYN